MVSQTQYPEARRGLVTALSLYACLGCVIFAVTILIADFVVPDHDWIADTISDLGAGRYEFIVDIGIYAFSAALIATALLAAHLHLGGWEWSLGLLGLALLGLIVFLVGARNEYGDQDNEGVVIHIYLVYALGLLLLLVPLALARGARLHSPGHARILIGLALLWLVSAPVFFFLPTDIDGLYERYLGVIAMAMVATLAHLSRRVCG
ncbi:DUF998 domain-containing protein [Marinovum sp.]|uniref:DUF998 domain-containing protein n=1 Tax=Marinovum sp. TaxID=2024839 RepID=UPI002B272F5E|nr:DUF998 domain-containing protein [Marinovum sp.]